MKRNMWFGFGAALLISSFLVGLVEADYVIPKKNGNDITEAKVYLPLVLLNYENIPEHWRDGLAAGVNWGLAEGYPNDVGINANPYVLDAEDFESGTVTILTEEDRYRLNTTVVSTTVYTGSYAGKHTWPQGYNGPTTRYEIPDSANAGSRPTYFVRMCMNFDDSFHPGEGFEGVGVKGFGVFSEPDWADTNEPCDGTNWYNAQVQFVGWGPSSKPEANNRYLWVGHLYSYNPYPADAVAVVGELANISSHRFSAYATPFKYLDFGGWHCYEVGLYLNTPGQYDGEARFWIDGILQSRVTNMRYRNIESLFPTDMHLNIHRTTENFPHTMIRWTDNIVLATRYIGPVKKE